jgi:pyruvate oxidase
MGYGVSVGAKGYTVTKREQLKSVFDKAKNSKIPVVIDIKITNNRPFPAEDMILDLEKYKRKEVDAFIKRYEVKNMPVLKDLL